MTNRSSSKQHGLNSVKRQQPKSKLRKRANKQKAALRKLERRSIVSASKATPPLSKSSPKEAITV